MSDGNPDLRKLALQHRDHLRAELGKVEEFLAMADKLSRFSENPRQPFVLVDEDKSSGSTVRPLNVFREG